MAEYIGDVNPNELTGGIEDDYINGMEGDDTLRGDGGNDTIYGDLGNDVLNGGAENDSLYGGSGDDWIEGNEGNDVLSGSADNDVLLGGAGNDTLDGGTGNDILSNTGNAGDDKYIFGRGYGQDVIYDDDGTSGLDTISFNADVAPADVSVRTTDRGDLILSINGTDDTLTVEGYFARTYYQIEQIIFFDGTIWDVSEVYRQEMLSATDDDDFLFGADQADTISGLGGNDTIYGRAGNDTLDGGTGNDILSGDAGDDTYIFGRGYGQDYIGDTDGTSGLDTISFNADVAPADVSVRTNSDRNLILSINGTDDTLTVAGYFYDPGYQIEQIKFYDGTIWDVSEVYRQEMLSATENDDFILGTDQSDTISGLGGNDYIDGVAGNDVLSGGAGSDVLYGGDDNDSLAGNEGDDTLYGDAGNDTLDGGFGNDALREEYSGDDTYIFGRGYGQDIIYDDGGNDTILVNPDTTSGDVNLTANANGDLILSINGTSDTLTVAGFYSDPANQIETIKFADETIWDPAEINMAPLVKKPFGGTMIVKEGVEYTLSIDLDAFIDFNVGDSLTYTATLADDSPLPAWVTFDPATLTVTGTPPHDSIGTWHVKVTATDTSGLSVSEYVDAIVVPEWAIFGTEDDDALPGTENNDIIVGLGGHDTLGGSETMYGGTGADTMYGGADADTYIVDDPGDVIKEFTGASEGEGNDTVISMISYALPDNVEIMWLQGTADINGTGNDGTNIIIGNSGDNIISGGGGGDWLCGGLDPENVSGNYGDDTIIGGMGNDSVAGFGYNETFVFSRGDGQDSILNCKPEGVDKIQFTEGISSTDPVFVRLDKDLIIYIDDNTVENDAGFFEPRTFGLGDALALGVDVIVLSDGQYLTREDILNIANAMSAINDDPNLDVLQKVDALKNSQEYNDLLAASWHDGASVSKLNPIPDVIVKEDIVSSVSIPDDTFFSTSSDLTYSAELSNGSALPSWIIFDQTTGTFSVNPSSESVGTTTSVILTATNTLGNSMSDEFNIIVVPAGTILGTEGDDNIVGTSGNELIYGFGGNDTIEGGLGDDTISGGTGNDEMNDNAGGNDTYLFGGSDGIDTITDTSGIDTLKLTDTTVTEPIILSADNTLIIASYIDATNPEENSNGVIINDQFTTGGIEVVELADGRYITLDDINNIISTFSEIYANPDVMQQYEALQNNQDYKDLLAASWHSSAPTPTAGDDVLYGTDGNDTINALGGHDIVYGLSGDDSLAGGAGNDTLYGASGNDTLNGGAGNDQLLAGDGNDTLNGGAGADVMIGGSGDDIYYVDNTGDVITENSNEGTDTIRSSVSYTISDNVENMTLTGTDAINGTGNVLDNRIIGNTAANTLSGEAGNDYLSGGAGDDQLLGGDGDDTLLGGTGVDVLTGGAGNDSLNGGDDDDQLLGGDGNDTLIGGAGSDVMIASIGNDSLNGGDGGDTLMAGDGNDTLNGGAGADVMIGGSGDDIYYVDNTGDVITENSNEGTDTIRSSVSYTISDNVENMTLTGTDAINGTGNVLDNRIIGNTAANTLSGEAGNDYLSGGAGDDQLLGGDGDDTLLGGTGVDVLTGGAGNDSLNGGDDDDQLLGGDGNDTLLGSAGSDILTGGVGNDLLNGGDGDDLLRGEDGDDTLVGGAGSDFMTGGAGNDTYYVDNGGDWITENAGTDIDIIRSSISYTISDNVENMTLTGTDAIDGTGNVLDNRIIGNTAANTLSGQAGNDYLSGGAGADILNGGEGNDTLTGGDGSDTYLFGNNDGRDRINETAGITGDIDALKLTEATITEPVIVKDGNNLYVFIDANNYVRVASEFQATNYGIERLEVSDGHYITRDDIQTIVDTMSAINDSGMGVIQKYNAMMESEQYQNILSESWQS